MPQSADRRLCRSTAQVHRHHDVADIRIRVIHNRELDVQFPGPFSLMRKPVISMYFATGFELGAIRCGVGWLVDVVFAGVDEEQPARPSAMANKTRFRMPPNSSAISRFRNSTNWVISPPLEPSRADFGSRVNCFPHRRNNLALVMELPLTRFRPPVAEDQ